MKRAEAEARGRKAERRAAWWLRLHGWRILGERLRVPVGEVDLVARRGRTVAFIEVKWRDKAADLDLAILENVGNLVCPAEFDTGAVKNVAILSVPEGHDKPLKYPLMFSICDVLLINKIDVMPYFDFDLEACKKYATKLNPNIKIIPISARTGEGIGEWADWLRQQVKAWNG